RPSFRPGPSPKPGQVLPDAAAEKMKLSDDQKKEVAALQKETDEKLDKLLKDDQKKRLKDMREAKGPGPFGGGGAVGGGMFGPGPGGGPPGLFRAPRYEKKYAGIPKDVKPGKTLEEILARPAPKEEKKDEKDGDKDKK